jgi:hypothetical protein
MTTRKTSLRMLLVGGASAAALLVLALGPQTAQAQLPVGNCVAPNEIPEDLVDAVEDEYALESFSDRACSATAKVTAKDCNKVVKIAAKCRNLVNAAMTQAANLACALLSDKSAQKACTSANKADLKSSQSEVKDQAKDGSETCADDVAPVILVGCEDPV